MDRILTIGYEGADLEDFLATVKGAGVSVLLDVREMPRSRRRGFSKTALREALADTGIDYRHERGLGSPKALRRQLRADGDYGRFFSGVRAHLKGQGVLLDRITRELPGTVALMCYERNFRECHRSIVAEYLERRTALRPKHIEVIHGAGGPH